MKPLRAPILALTACLLAALAGAEPDSALRPPSDFAAIEDASERSQALFLEAARVLTHPRCVNCHPSGDRPNQGAGEPHQPPVVRGPSGHGDVGMRCATCHQQENVDAAQVPGAPHWHLAPRSMAWEGLSAGEICEQLKDRTRNGGRDVSAIVAHMTQDPLVLWAWDPGESREPAPGTPASFGRLIRAWADDGAVCPD